MIPPGYYPIHVAPYSHPQGAEIPEGAAGGHERDTRTLNGQNSSNGNASPIKIKTVVATTLQSNQHHKNGAGHHILDRGAASPTTTFLFVF